VLEIKDRRYTERYGDDRVEVSEILDVDPGNREATRIADIMQVEAFEPSQFDCVIFAQTLQLIREPERALETLRYILKPGGVLLLTCPGITRIASKGPAAAWYWSFTALSLEMLLANRFGRENVAIGAHGNVFAASCFLWGIAQEEITPAELEYQDARYPVILTACARKN
jgi:SAM-dependent methyltransferase